MWRRLRSIGALLVLALLATSCYSLESSIVVNEDGSGSFAVEYIIDKDTTEASLIAGDLITACDAVTVMQNAAPAGSVFTPLDSSSQCGARVTMEFANEVELLTGMELLSERSRFAGFGHFPNITITRGSVDGAWNFQAQFKPPLPENLDSQADFRSEVSSGTFVVMVNLPGRQVEHNADRITEDGTMVFEINPLVDPSGQFFVQTEPGAKIIGVDETSSFPWKSVGFFVVALGALVAALAIIRRSKKRRQYEGEDDDDDAMISASERLGLGSSEPEPMQHDDAVGHVQPSDLQAASSDEPYAASAGFSGSASVAEPEARDSLFNAAAASSQVDSWPAAPHTNATSPVFDAVEEPQDPASWVTAAQPIDPRAPEPIAPSQPVGMEPLADWPGSPAPERSFESLPSETVDSGGFTSEVLAPMQPNPESVDATPGLATAATDGWPTGPLVASAAVAAAPAAVVVDHGTQAPQMPQGVDAFSSAPHASTPVSEPTAWSEAVPEASSPAPTAAATPTQSDMQWDEQRNTYVVYDPRRSSWMAFDDTTQTWQQIS